MDEIGKTEKLGRRARKIALLQVITVAMRKKNKTSLEETSAVN